jgi:hypothetical protein
LVGFAFPVVPVYPRATWAFTIQKVLIVFRILTVQVRRVEIAEFNSAVVQIRIQVVKDPHNVRTVFKVGIILVVLSHCSLLLIFDE